METGLSITTLAIAVTVGFWVWRLSRFLNVVYDIQKELRDARQIRARRLEEKLDLLLKYTDLSEGDRELLREINKISEPPA